LEDRVVAGDENVALRDTIDIVGLGSIGNITVLDSHTGTARTAGATGLDINGVGHFVGFAIKRLSSIKHKINIARASACTDVVRYGD
jgi:hypothetical protein